MTQQTSEYLPYKYHVVYLFSDGEARGTGSIDLSRRHKFRSNKDIKATKKYLEDKNDYQDVVILSWLAYEKETWFSKVIGIFK